MRRCKLARKALVAKHPDTQARLEHRHARRRANWDEAKEIVEGAGEKSCDSGQITPYLVAARFAYFLCFRKMFRLVQSAVATSRSVSVSHL